MKHLKKNKLLRIGSWLYELVDTEETPDSILEDLCYEDDDRELIEMWVTETH